MERNKELEFDELLIKYFDDTATKEEENRVLEYVAENEECMNEMMQLAESIRVQRESEKKRHKNVVVFRAAASVALLLVAGGIWFAIGHNTNNGDEMLAINNKSSEPINSCDTGSYPGLIGPASNNQFIKDPLSVGSNNKGLHAQTTIAQNESETEKAGKMKAMQDTTVSKEVHPVRPDGTSVSHIASMEVGSSNKHVPSEKQLIVDCTIPTEWPRGTDLIITWTSNADKVTLTFISVNNEKDTRELKSSQGSFIYPADMRENYLRYGSIIKCVLTVSSGSVEEQQSGIIKLTEKK